MIEQPDTTETVKSIDILLKQLEQIRSKWCNIAEALDSIDDKDERVAKTLRYCVRELYDICAIHDQEL